MKMQSIDCILATVDGTVAGTRARIGEAPATTHTATEWPRGRASVSIER
eukprot:COSAG02_NODE_4947_length_4798_cov_54.379017_4_plen_49_part_00